MRAAELLPHGKDLIAVDAKDLSTDLVALGLARGFSSARSASELLKEVEGMSDRPDVVLLVGAIEESTAPEELVRDLLVPLSRHLGLPFIAGALRSLLPSASSSDLVIDLDRRGEPVAGPAVSLLAFGNDVDGTPLLASAGADRIGSGIPIHCGKSAIRWPWEASPPSRSAGTVPVGRCSGPPAIAARVDGYSYGTLPRGSPWVRLSRGPRLRHQRLR